MATRRRLPEIDDGRRVHVVVVCEERSAVDGVQVQKSTCEISFLLQVFHLWTTLFCLTFVSMKRSRQAGACTEQSALWYELYKKLCMRVDFLWDLMLVQNPRGREVAKVRGWVVK